MCRAVVPLVVVLFAPTVTAAPVPKSLKKGASPDGVWKLTEFWSNGTKGSAQGMTPVWVLDGEAFYVGPKVESNYWQLSIPDPTKPTVRRFAHGQAATTSTFPAMVEVDGDTLRFCYGFDSSTQVTECGPVKNVHYYVFTRLSPDDPAAHPPK
jgi:hypothetical protein